MPESKVRIGFVGVGSMGQCAHLKNYATLPDCEVVAIAEVREALGQQVAARYGVPRVYPSHAEMLAAETLDGIVATQPFDRHGVLIPELLAGRNAGVHRETAGRVRAGGRAAGSRRRGERDVVDARLSQAQRPRHDVRQRRDRPPEGDRRAGQADLRAHPDARRRLDRRRLQRPDPRRRALPRPAARPRPARHGRRDLRTDTSPS